MTFDARDPSLNHVVSATVDIHNNAGLLGAYLSGFLNDVFGIAAYVWPVVFGAVGVACVYPLYELLWWRWLGYFLLTICLLFVGAAWDIQLGDVHGGGMIGQALYYNATLFLSPVGSGLLWFFIFVLATHLSFGISWLQLVQRFGTFCKQRYSSLVTIESMRECVALPQWNTASKSRWSTQLGNTLRQWRQRLGMKKKSQDGLPELYVDVDVAGTVHTTDTVETANTIHVADIYTTDTVAQTEKIDSETSTSYVHDASPELLDDALRYVYPEDTIINQDNNNNISNIEHVIDVPRQENTPPIVSEKGETTATTSSAMPASAASEQNMAEPIHAQKSMLPSLDLLQKGVAASPTVGKDMEIKGRALMACLADFSIGGELVRVTPGPVVTMYEVRPAAGVRVSRIANLSDDLALALKALAVRIQAPIPGSDTVGIEIPNVQRAMVNFREILESPTFRDDKGQLSMALGKDIAGNPFVADLSRMPHLLVAGATGAGKSVGLNSILLSLLYTTYPHEMQLLLIDPKRIEMAVYADLPHLVHPVVTEMQHAKTALEWAVHEMDQRYSAMARLGVRNIAGFNQKLQAFGRDIPPEFADLEQMPYLVIIIDELADLMLTAAREVETSIVRLAQLARASGIHMILATQRPSVDVVTGLIKANFPCRISFQVTSKHDSRTILDMVGAEYLLGRGDMLYKPSGGKLMRLHGPFVPDEEVQAVVAHWKKQMAPAYRVNFAQWGNEMAESLSNNGGGADASGDALYGDVRDFVYERETVSASLIQRRFKIGFNRAARLMEQLEADGLIGAQDGSKVRKVLH